MMEIFFILLYFIFLPLCYSLGSVALRIIYRNLQEIFGERVDEKFKKDKVILISGATSGIGLALTKFWYRKGWSIIATKHSRREPEELRRLQRNNNLNGKPKLFFVTLDVSSPESVEKSFEEVKGILSANNLKLYALVNNAGITYMYQAIWAKKSQINKLIQTNLLGNLLMVRQYTALLIGTPHSRIINVGSGTAFFYCGLLSIYSATKAATSQYMSCLKYELQSYNVKTVTVHVGNLVQNTSVLSNCDQDMDDVYEEFTEREKKIYKYTYERHRKKLQQTKEWLINVQQGKKKKQELSLMFRCIVYCCKIISGQIDSKIPLEDSSAMINFDNALLLKQVPHDFFSGNYLHTKVFGLILLSCDDYLKRFTGYLLDKNDIPSYVLIN